MPEFSRGVKEYIHARAMVDVTFPVDFRDHAEVNCHQCKYYRRSYKKCGLNGEICEYPDKYIGSRCPLTFYSADKEEDKHEEN